MSSLKNKKTAKKKTPREKSKLFWHWIAGLNKNKPAKVEKPHPRTVISRRSLTKRTIGTKSHRKIDITIIGLGLIIAILFGTSNIQDLFKASILSLSQKNAVVTAARARLGIPYQLGAQGPTSYDCSGLTGSVVKEALSITLPRTSRDQYGVGRTIEFANLGIGDLVFFKTSGGDSISHVGIVTSISGNDIKMVHANSYTGKVEEEDIKNSVYWQKTYFGAREITEATKDIVAPSTPDTTHVVDAVTATKTSDEYNTYFPPSELNDARLKVGAATIEQSTDTTRTISDTVIRSTPLATTSPTSTPSPSITPTLTIVTPTSTPTIASPSPTPSQTPTPPPQPSLSPTFSPSPSTTSPLPTPSQLSTPSPSSAVERSTPIFSDITTTHKDYEAIQKLVDAGIISGYADGTFRPNASVSRGELLKMIYKASKKPLSTSKKSIFTDVSGSNPFLSYIITAFNDGLIKGYSNKTFHPNQSVTRAEGSKMILKGFGITSDITRISYSDLSIKSDLAPYLAYLISQDLLSATNKKALPNTALTRGETAYIIAHLLD